MNRDSVRNLVTAILDNIGDTWRARSMLVDDIVDQYETLEKQSMAPVASGSGDDRYIVLGSDGEPSIPCSRVVANDLARDWNDDFPNGCPHHVYKLVKVETK